MHISVLIFLMQLVEEGRSTAVSTINGTDCSVEGRSVKAGGVRTAGSRGLRESDCRFILMVMVT